MTVTTRADKPSREEKILEGMAVWASYYRSNPHRFVKDFLKIDLRLFQKIIIYAMNVNDYFCYIAARGMSKTFISAVFCCVRCVLYPGTVICIASGTRTQATTVLRKIRDELMPKSPALRACIRDVKIGASGAEILFKGGSVIRVVTAADTSRSNRANILILDEFRMIDEDIINAVLKKFLTGRREPGYLSKPEYKHLVGSERNKQIYLSSAWYKDHWSYQKVKDFCVGMIDPARNYFVCGLPYQLSIKEGLAFREDIEDEMSEASFNEVLFSMEMCAEWFGDNGSSFFEYESIAKNRKIVYPMLPPELSSLIKDHSKIGISPKGTGEKRILSVDIAVQSSKRHKNDASAVFINQLLPTKTGRYTSNIVYTESYEGKHTEDQALRIRKLYDMYACDYIVIDATGVGWGICDALLRDINDPDTGEVYPALSCCNDNEWAARCKSPNAEKAVWIIKPNARFNSECAMLLREGFRLGKIRLLNNEYEGERSMMKMKGYKDLEAADKMQLNLPYVNTTLLIKEIIGLRHEEKAGSIRVYTRRNERKDRYSSLSYNYYIACQLESKIKKNSDNVSASAFIFRAPKLKGRR